MERWERVRRAIELYGIVQRGAKWMEALVAAESSPEEVYVAACQMALLVNNVHVRPPNRLRVLGGLPIKGGPRLGPFKN